MLLLRAATASRMRGEDFARQKEIAATLTDDDTSDRAAVARGATLLHRAWANANEARTKLRNAWHEFFKRFDVLLTPVAATAAFPHDRNPNREERTVNVNGKSVPYAEQLFFAGARQPVISAGNCSTDRLDRRGITGGPADYRARGRGPDGDRIRPAARR